MPLEEETRPLSVELDVGTLAIVLLVVVVLCSLFTLLSLCFYHRASPHQPLHCSGCHRLVAVQGVPLPPHIIPSAVQGVPLPPHIIPSAVQGVLLPPHIIPSSSPRQSMALSRRHHPTPDPVPLTQHSTPAVAVPTSHQTGLRCGNSATFQRLGMQAQPSLLVEEARALELPDYPSHDSPAEAATEVTDLEPLTPRPAGRQLQHRVERSQDVRCPSPRGDLVCPGDPMESPCGLGYSVGDHPAQRKLGQVRLLVQPGLQTPATKTPGNAAKTAASKRFVALPGRGVGRVVTPLIPTRRFEDNSQAVGDLPLLEVSTLSRTVVTTGDLQDLCETSLSENVTTSHQAVGRPGPPVAVTPGQGVVSVQQKEVVTPASVESGSHTLTNKDLEQLNRQTKNPEGLMDTSAGPEEVFLETTEERGAQYEEEELPVTFQRRSQFEEEPIVSYNYHERAPHHEEEPPVTSNHQPPQRKRSVVDLMAGQISKGGPGQRGNSPHHGVTLNKSQVAQQPIRGENFV